MAETEEGDGGGESTVTVIVAAVANLGIALAKAVAGVISGSSAMLSEAAHSVADTVTELLLLTALKRSGKPADEDHPWATAPSATSGRCSPPSPPSSAARSSRSTTASTPSSQARTSATR